MDITRFDALARKAKRRGLAKTIPSMLEIIEDHDESLFKRMQDPSHCLHHLLPPVRHNTLGRLRSRGHYTLPQINFKQHKLSFPIRCQLPLQQYVVHPLYALVFVFGVNSIPII